MASRTVLISGAGIAGCTLTYWMARNGWSVTVMERGASLRTSGSPVDVRGPAAHVAERMNIASQLRDARIRLDGMTLLDSAGRRVARVDIGTLRSLLASHDTEIARGDLALILHAASADRAEYVFGDSIRALVQDDNGVDVTFERSRARRFDLVVGADGMHSTVRRLMYGADHEFVVHAGLYAATVALPRGCDAGREMFLLRTPGRLVALHPCQGNPLAYFVYWHPELPEFDYRNIDQHKRLLEIAFAGLGWRVPEFVAASRAASDMYFDQVARVHVPDWSRGRIALLGDAASCVSLFGDGSTLAMAGAYQLAAALAEFPADPQRAFNNYQAIHGKLVSSKQKFMAFAASNIVPKSPIGLWVSTHMFWRAMGALGAVVRQGQRLRKKFS
jgi:2-polyprenyl-6-methoxyphenol hydroxylase-like FAD-dependent oxidoreductase